MNKQVLIIVMVVVLVIFVGVQAVQISDLKDEISDGAFNTGMAITKTQSNTRNANAQQSASAMVGGC